MARAFFFVPLRFCLAHYICMFGSALSGSSSSSSSWGFLVVTWSELFRDFLHGGVVVRPPASWALRTVDKLIEDL
jgi:hypothetical protein